MIAPMLRQLRHGRASGFRAASAPPAARPIHRRWLSDDASALLVGAEVAATRHDRGWNFLLYNDAEQLDLAA